MASASEKYPQDEKNGAPDSHIVITDHQVGVWKLRIARPSFLKGTKQYREDLLSSLPIMWRFAADVFGVSPRLSMLYLLCELWIGVDDSLQMYLSNKLLRIVEAGVITRKPDSWAIGMAFAIRCFATVMSSYLSLYERDIHQLLDSRVTRHFDLFLIEADLGADLLTSQEHGSKKEATGQQAWEAFKGIVEFFSSLVRGLSQLAVIVGISRSVGGPLFVLLCVIHPIFECLNVDYPGIQTALAYTNNSDYWRMKGLNKFGGASFRQDIISGGLREWIIKQYKNVHRKLGEIPNGHPYMMYQGKKSRSGAMAVSSLGNLPMAFCALNAVLRPENFSIASLAILQQSSTTLRYSFGILMYTLSVFHKSTVTIRALYASSTIVNSMKAGDTSYPRKEKGSDGMGFELRNVSFSYPGSQNASLALQDISLTIKPGHLVVIVGANGSGKSTLIRILARLYDPTSGHILIDGLPSQDYRVDDLHKATALLSQENCMYPLSLSENIGLGYPDKEDDAEMVAEAALQGGASEFISKLKDGIQTSLDPNIDCLHWNLVENKSHPLYTEMEQIQKKVEISGGEKQRVVAARAFMRFKSGKVKLAAVDEPSSALDAEGELKLFENLIRVREGKTMVFVTHRFGHLTKHADNIICMKHGSVVETGSHEELMKMQGEYAKLYQIQAGAFS